MTFFSLDDFIESNQQKVLVHPSSAPVKFDKITFLPGSAVDLSVLAGQGYQLKEMNGILDLSRGIGYAQILNEDRSNTGYHLVHIVTPGDQGKNYYYMEDDEIYQRFDNHVERGGELFGNFSWRRRN